MGVRTFSLKIDVCDGRTQKVYAGLHDGALQLTSPSLKVIRVDEDRVLAGSN